MTAVRQEPIRWHPKVTVAKFDPDQVTHVMKRLNLTREPTPDELHEFCDPEYARAEGNALTTAGLTRITALLTGGGGLAITNATARIGVGDSATAPALGDTDLKAVAGATHRYFQPQAATYPQTAVGVITFQSVFGVNDGNFTWAEWCVDVSAAAVGGTTVGTTMINRAVAALGAKVVNAVWTFTATITLS